MNYKELLGTLNQKVIESLGAEDFQLEFEEVDDPQAVASLEKLWNGRLPDDLKNFYLHTGAVAHVNFADVWDTLRIHSATRIAANRSTMGFIDFIDDYWGGRPEFEALAPEVVETLNRDLLVFGVRYIDDNVHEYLFVDRSSGRYGCYLFDQDDVDLDSLKDLAEGPPDLLDTLEELLTKQFNAICEGG